MPPLTACAPLFQVSSGVWLPRRQLQLARISDSRCGLLSGREALDYRYASGLSERAGPVRIGEKRPHAVCQCFGIVCANHNGCLAIGDVLPETGRIRDHDGSGARHRLEKHADTREVEIRFERQRHDGGARIGIAHLGMCEGWTFLAEVRGQPDGVVCHELETQRRTPSPQSPHRLHQQCVISMTIVPSSDDEIGLGFPITAPEL